MASVFRKKLPLIPALLLGFLSWLAIFLILAWGAESIGESFQFPGIVRSLAVLGAAFLSARLVVIFW
jgi:hypothetical protein